MRHAAGDRGGAILQLGHGVGNHLHAHVKARVQHQAHALADALTPPDEWPRHIMHEQRGLKPLKELCARLKIPSEHQQLAEAVCREHLNVHRIDELRDATMLDLLGRCDALRRPERVARIALCCEADKRGRLGFEEGNYPQGETLKRLHQAALSVQARDLDLTHLKGPAVGEALARVKAIAGAR